MLEGAHIFLDATIQLTTSVKLVLPLLFQLHSYSTQGWASYNPILFLNADGPALTQETVMSADSVSDSVPRGYTNKTSWTREYCKSLMVKVIKGAKIKAHKGQGITLGGRQ